MAKQKVIALDRSTMELVAGLTTLLSSNLMTALYNRGVIDDSDIDQILADTASGGLGDASLDAMAAAMANSLRTQLATRLN